MTLAPDPPLNDDLGWMRLALAEAQRGLGYVEPNPLVGCVIVGLSGKLAAGYHQRFGGPHAEVDALQQVRAAGRSAELPQSTAYVTLEPCCHIGKTPPCTRALIESGVGRVVVAMRDPFERVQGGGIAALQAAGIAVDVGVAADEAERLNAAYLKRLAERRPWVIGKWAMSVDGKIATHTGESQWISGAKSREVVHRLRGRVDAILVGIGTALADDPLLTARELPSPAPRTALRVVADSSLRLPPDSRLALTARETPVLVWTGPTASSESIRRLTARGVRVECSPISDPSERLAVLLDFLTAEFSATNLLVEGGGGLLGSLYDLQQLDQCEVFLGPRIIGGATALTPIQGLGSSRLADSPHVEVLGVEQLADDIHASYRLTWPARRTFTGARPTG